MRDRGRSSSAASVAPRGPRRPRRHGPRDRQAGPRRQGHPHRRPRPPPSRTASRSTSSSRTEPTLEPAAARGRPRSPSRTGCGARSLVALTTDRTERLDPGSVLHDRPGRADGRARRARTRTAGSCRSRASPTATQAEALHGLAAAGRAARRHRRRAVGPRADRRRRRARRRHRGRAPSPRSQANPARDLLVLDDGRAGARRRSSSTTAPGRVTIDPPEGLFDLSDRRSTRMRIDVFTIFPDMVDGLRRPEPARQGPGAAALLDVRVHDLRDARPPTRTARVDDAPFGGGAGMVLMPEPIFAAVEAVDPPRPLLYLEPGRPALRPGRGPRAGRRRRLLACSAAATRASTSGCASTSSTASCRSATTCSAAARWRRWSCSRPSAGSCPGVMGNETSADDESLQRRPARVPALHPPGRVPRAGRCPRCCAPATTAAVARWRRAQALRPHAPSAAPT